MGDRLLLPDVNVLIYAHRTSVAEHDEYAAWLKAVVAGPAPFAVSELALSGFVRIVTNARVFPEPTPPDLALEFCERLVQRPNCVRLRPGERHWSLFAHLCRITDAKGKLVADAYHAALALEQGCELVTTDADFARFPSLRWSHPLRARPG